MADDIDLEELHDGSLDLARRDFRKADLSRLDLSNRDFSAAHLESAIFAGSDLSHSSLVGAKTSGMNAEGANLEGVKARQTVIFQVNLKNANLSGSDFSRSHFSRSDLTGADLRGANFKNAVFNEGNTFEACIVDDDTVFDDASIFRPLARQDAFHNYRVERGKLVRKTDEIPARMHDEQEIGIYTANPPQFSALSGEVTFDYSNNDGRAIFGDGKAAFETKWSRSGKDSIHAYVNLPSVTAIAIGNGVSTLEQATAELLSTLNYSSRTRSPNKGQILVARNDKGQSVAFKIMAVTSTSHGDLRDELTLQYRILSTSHEEAALIDTSAPENNLSAQVEARIEELILGLGALAPTESNKAPALAGLGHNNPPEETPIDRKEYDDVIAVLQNVQAEIRSDQLAKQTADDAGELLAGKTKKILTWAARKLELTVDEFAKEIGKTLGGKTIVIMAWVTLTGIMSDVVGLLDSLAKFLQ